MELVRAILEAVARSGMQSDEPGYGKIDVSSLRQKIVAEHGVDPDLYDYHLKLLGSAGFFVDDNPASGLSWVGCDYLDGLRNEDRGNVV